MFDVILDKLKQVLSSRLLPIAIVFMALFGALISRIFTLQIVEGETHSEAASLKYTKTREIKATRGNIYDRKGVLLAYNKLTYSVVLEESPSLEKNEQKNAMLYNLIQILEDYDNEIETEFGISLDKNGNLYFNEKDEKAINRFKKNAYAKRSVEELDEEQKNATAEEVFEYLRHGSSIYSPMFNISDDYSLEDALKIMQLRYAIYTNYPKYNQIIISSNVNDETVAAIYENSRILPGVDIKQQTYRVYNDSLYNSHILGYTGLIGEAELEAHQGDAFNYNNSDVIGKLGIEKVYESDLAGTKGTEEISVNESGKFLQVLNRTEPIAGKDIYLTIDSALNKAYYHIIEKNLAGILLSKINNSMDDGTRGESSKNIKIPIYDVYFALINNNVINIKSFQEDDATGLEKQVYQKYQDKEKEVLKELDHLLALDCVTVNSDASEEMQEYLNYIYSLLNNRFINDKENKYYLFTTEVDKNDSNYIAYHNNKLSLSKFLQYALSKNWIDLTELNIGSEYYSTDELYAKLLEYIKNMLVDDSTFNKKVYNNLVYSYKLSGTEICLLLFDQGVLKYNKQDVTGLENGSISAYSFITDKIRNLEITPAQLALDPCSASVVVTDVKTGDVIAMVSYPSYDNNLFANKIDSNYYNKLYNDLSLPMINRPAKQKTAPGSTFKMLTAAAGLEEGVIKPGETIRDEVVFHKSDPPPSCWSKTSHGAVDVSGALEVSCNYFFYETSWRLGQDSSGVNRDQIGLEKLAKYAKILGLDRKSGIEIDEAEPEVSDEGSIRSAIGQGTNNYTPVQLARYVTTVASSGNCFELTLIDKIMDKDGEKEPVSTKITEISDSTWNLIHDGMYRVVNNSRSSTSRLFKNYPIEIAGKTGTAQQSYYHGNHALFVSYAPYKNPEIAVSVVIPNGYASSNAVELSRDVYSYYFNLPNKEDLVKGPAELPESESSAFSD